jgi:N-acyl-L-homoserine lactone synthetase
MSLLFVLICTCRVQMGTEKGGDMERVSAPLARAAIEYLRARQAQSLPRLTDTAMARRLRVTQTEWSQMRLGKRGMGLEVLCRSIKAYPGLLTVVITFLGNLVSQAHNSSADEHMGEKEEDREGIGAGSR